MNRLAIDGIKKEADGVKEETDRNDEPLKFPIKTVDKKVFEQLVKWMEEHDGKPDVVFKQDPKTEEVIFLLHSKILNENSCV